MASLYFKNLELSSYCVLDFGKAKLNTIEVNVEMPCLSTFVCSLFYQRKGLFVLGSNYDFKLNRFKLSPQHFEVSDHSFFVNKSYLYFWRKKLSDIEALQYSSLLLTL
jgi:hypothetical protein